MIKEFIKREIDLEDYIARRAGANVRLPHNTGPFLRLAGDKIETSQNASFPVTDAMRAYPLIKRIKRAGRVWQRNGETIKLGYFQIDRIDDLGNVRAGCHFVKWEEIERMARELGIEES